jgi:hypothetical protein
MNSVVLHYFPYPYFPCPAQQHTPVRIPELGIGVAQLGIGVAQLEQHKYKYVNTGTYCVWRNRGLYGGYWLYYVCINRGPYAQSHSIISSSRIIGIEPVTPRSGRLALAAATP